MQEIACNLCGSKYYRVVYKIKPQGPVLSLDESYKITEDKNCAQAFRLVRCLRCGLIYINPQEGVLKIAQRYHNMEDDVYVSEEAGRRAAARILLKKISKFRRFGKLLDIGCATGFLLDEAKKQGWEVNGLELSIWAAEFARSKFDLNIFEGQLADAKLSHNYFDVIIMSDVIEHLVDPKKYLEEIRRILKPNGILCISTPDINSFLSKILQAKWWGIKYSHLFYFSKGTLTQMLDASGFKVIKYSSHIRVFSVKYWADCLKNHSIALYEFFNFVVNLLFLTNKPLAINFKDQMELFAIKKRSLEFINEDEINFPLAQRKMKTVVVLPAYNAEKTLAKTVGDIPRNLVDDIILVDDYSKDKTVKVAKELGLKVFQHKQNKGYGANQKTCYSKALEMGAEIIVMVHPDYQYDPVAISEMIKPIQAGRADAVFGSRMMKGGALEGGMPLWKHNANILLTAIENVVLGTYLTEYHSGFRAYSAKYLRTVNFMANSDKFIFDTEIIVQGVLHYLKIEEVPIKTRYFNEASSIKFIPSVMYGLGILITLLKYILHIKGIIRFKQFK